MNASGSPIDTLDLAASACGYFHRVLTETLVHVPDELQVIVIGRDVARPARLMAGAGYRATAVEVFGSRCSIAEETDTESLISRRWRPAIEPRIDAAAASFDVAILSGVPTAKEDRAKTLSEAYRVLKFGGVLCFYAVNRTILSHIMLHPMRPSATCIERPKASGSADRIGLRPGEVIQPLERLGIAMYRMHGLGPPVTAIPRILAGLVRLRLGHGSQEELLGSLPVGPRRSTRLAYIGWGVKFG